MPRQPNKRAAWRDTGSSGRLSHPPPIGTDALHQQGSTLPRQARILVEVHPPCTLHFVGKPLIRIG